MNESTVMSCWDCGNVAPLTELPIWAVTPEGEVLCPLCGCHMRDVEVDVPMPEVFQAFIGQLNLRGL